MPWVRMDDGYPDHPKVDKVGPLAAWLNVCGWAYAARNLTDGFVPKERVGRLADVPNAPAMVKKLVDAELWELSGEPCEKCVAKRETAGSGEADDGYLIHDYLDYNPSKAQILRERAATAQRVAEHRYVRSNGVTSPVTNAESNGVGAGVGTGVGNSVGTAVSNGVGTSPPYPSPTRTRLKTPVPDPDPAAAAARNAREVPNETSCWKCAADIENGAVQGHRGPCEVAA